MRTYETIFIVHPDIVGDDLDAVIDKYKQILTDEGANVLKADNWGTRTLAYLVKKQSQGCYVLMIFDGPPPAIAEFERRMRIDEAIIKFQTVLLEGGYEAPVVEAPAEEAVAEEAVAGEAVAEEPAEEAEKAEEAKEA
ncbi:MAG: 30S ribosomal protein S6 [Desulfuromonadales bacterium]|nr:30S ribosomal protein S6 [Desulfuromonadales bacterium]